MITNADRARAMVFLDYIYETCRIKSWGTSWIYFRQYKQLYASVTGRLMDRNDSKEVKKVGLLAYRLPISSLTRLASGTTLSWF